MAVRSKKKIASRLSVVELLEHGVSQSEMTTFLECRQKLKLSQEGVAPRQVSTPLVYGQLGHDCLEGLYRWFFEHPDRYWGDDSKWVMQFVDGIVSKHRAEHFEYNEVQLQTLEHWNVQLRVTLSEYFQFWGYKEEEWEWLGLERPIPHLAMHGTYLEGKLDGLFQGKRDRLGFLDHKFKGQIADATLMDTLETDFQLLTYALSIRQEFDRLPSFALYNCIRRPSLKLTQKETLQQHEIRLREHIQKDPTHYFKRFEVPFDHTLVDHFEKELGEIMGEYKTWVESGKSTRKYGNPCNGRYGVCGMYGYCHRDDRVNYMNVGAGGYRPIK